MFASVRNGAAVCALLLPLLSLYAQEPTPASAGGMWTKSDETFPSDGRKIVVFRLPAAEAELGRSPEIQLMCSGDGQLVQARYFADTELLAKDGDYRNYEAAAVIPAIVIDKKHFKGVWDLLPGSKAMELDKKSLRAIFKGRDMQVRYRDKAYNNLVDQFIVSGLDHREVVKACGNQGWF
jgi:hypothetical protein